MQYSNEKPRLFERLGGRPKLDLFLKTFYATVRIDHAYVGLLGNQDRSRRIT